MSDGEDLGSAGFRGDKESLGREMNAGLLVALIRPSTPPCRRLLFHGPQRTELIHRVPFFLCPQKGSFGFEDVLDQPFSAFVADGFEVNPDRVGTLFVTFDIGHLAEGRNDGPAAVR